MRPGGPAVCDGTVAHRRFTPTGHSFTYRVSYAWLDPDEPEALCRRHWAWSSRRPAPVRFRRSDYGTQPTGSLGLAARRDLTPLLGRAPEGPVRMLTQLRRWGWLFNPITLYFVWDHGEADPTLASLPVGAVVEVSNTPWKQRIRYPILLDPGDGSLRAEFDKRMHVSPFLEMDYQYRLAAAAGDEKVDVSIDVIDRDGSVVLTTHLKLDRKAPTRELLGRSLLTAGLSTHRVSIGIHHQAARLWAKGVRFVRHPRRKSDDVGGGLAP